MTDTDQKREDAVLKRMLKTPPKPRKERLKAGAKRSPKTEQKKD